MHITALLRDAQGSAATNVPLTLVVERPDGLEYRRVAVPDQGIGGRSLSVPINSAASTGTWRVRAFTDPKRPAVGETTFLVEDYVPDRLEFDLAAPSGRSRSRCWCRLSPVAAATPGATRPRARTSRPAERHRPRATAPRRPASLPSP